MISTSARLGGVRLTSLEWVSQDALLVRFESVNTGWLHHLYAGRQKIGQTLTPGQRSFTARLVESEWPQPLTLVAVDPADSDDDLGALLPDRPFNSPRLSFTAAGAAWNDAKTIEVVSSAVPGDPIDGTELARKVYQWQGPYSIDLPPLESGYRALRVQGRDACPPDGNVGAAVDTVVRIVAHPPDLVLSAGRRFRVAVAAGVATIDCEVP